MSVTSRIERPGDARWLLHVGILVIVILATATPAGAAEPGADCLSAYALGDRGRALSPAPAAAAAGLPTPFAFEPWQGDPRALQRKAGETVLRQVSSVHVPACFRDKVATITGRVDFLSPYEFLVVSAMPNDPARRDELLSLYARQPADAVRAISPIYPSARAEMILATKAYYDVEAARVRVNVGRVDEAQAHRVLVHEFWHAMPRPRQWTTANGTTYRATGFWIQRLMPNGGGWTPADNSLGLPFESYQLEEAMATLMEDEFAGPPPRARRELEGARQYLLGLFERAGRDAVLRLYVESRPLDLRGLESSAGR